MEKLGCGNLKEMCDKVGTSLNMTVWMAYLMESERREAEKMKQMFGE
jgi:hypothetical protein